MIENEVEFDQSIHQLASMYRALAVLRSDLFEQNPQLFAVMAEGPVDEIHRLQSAIDAYVGKTDVEKLGVDLWLSIRGRGIEAENAPASVLTAFLDAMRKAIQSAAEMLTAGTLTTRPTAALKEACDLRLVTLQPGSIRIGMRLPLPPQEPLFPGPSTDVARSALTELLAVADWAQSHADPYVLEQRIDDVHRRRVLLNAVKTLVPRPRGTVDSVELLASGLGSASPIRLTRDAHRKIASAMAVPVDETIETYEGELREIDLDELSFTLRNLKGPDDLEQISCNFEPELLASAKEALDRRVVVTGTRQLATGRRAPVFRVSALEIIDDVSGG